MVLDQHYSLTEPFQNPGGSDIELTPSYVSTMHHRLIQTGDCLRMLTNDLDPLTQPGASYPKCAAGDILLSVLALITVRIIQHRYAREELQVTVPEIRKALKEFILMALFKDEHHCVYLKCAETLERNSDRAGGEDMQISISDRMFAMLVGQSMPSVSTIEQLRDVFKVKTLERSELQLAKMKAGNPTPHPEGSRRKSKAYPKTGAQQRQGFRSCPETSWWKAVMSSHPSLPAHSRPLLPTASAPVLFPHRNRQPDPEPSARSGTIS